MIRVELYLIEILHQTTTARSPQAWSFRCILSKFYIKPQQRVRHKLGHSCCILSKFYIKPQHLDILQFWRDRCILSKFYIKPQQLNWEKEVPVVVSYRNSTSNHNCFADIFRRTMLYLIEILHQTTTLLVLPLLLLCCILSKFYIKPQHGAQVDGGLVSCILSKFYIKPQRRASY